MADGGFELGLAAIARGIEPDPELHVDQWAEDNIILPKGAAAEHGEYRVARTPYAQQVMKWLSPGHPCKRVVVMAASQLLKTQVALNWLLGSIDLAPDNMLVLLPTLPLSKRVSSRIGKSIAACDAVRDKVASPRARDKTNSIAQKEFNGGTMYVTTAGSASNLAEIPLRYLYCDEVDRWEGSVGGEGDPVKLADARLSTHERDRKAYYTSSPTIEGLSRIAALYRQGTQNEPYVHCPHCDELQKLEWENMDWDGGESEEDIVTRAYMKCPHNGCVIEESDKPLFLTLEKFVWVQTAVGDGETESCTLSALYAPLGWVSWLTLAREYVEAKRAEEAGDSGAMQVFENTRLARLWRGGSTVSTAETLMGRSEPYREWTVPAGGLVLTAGVDVQGDRLAVSVWAWGVGEEGWLVWWGELDGSTLLDKRGAWAKLEEFVLMREYEHASGARLRIRAMSVDTGDGSSASQDAAYSFCRRHRRRGVLAIKGDSERGRLRRDIYTPPKPAIDVNKKNKAWKYGLQPYLVGTSAAKDLLIEGRLPMTGSGPGHLHWYQNVRIDWFDQVLAEVKVSSRKHRGRKVWECKVGVRNEGLDTLVYAFHAARHLKINLWKPSTWAALEEQMRQRSLLPAQSEVSLELLHDVAEVIAEEAAADAQQRNNMPATEAVDEPVADQQQGPSPATPVRPQAKPKQAPRRPAPRRGGFVKGWN